MNPVEETTQLFRLIKVEDSERAFHRLFTLHYERLYRIAFFYLQREDWAKEAALDVFATLWQKRKEIIVPADFRSFSYTMTRNAALNLLDREQHHQHDDLLQADGVETSYSPAATLEQEELFVLYQRTLDSLPDRCREVFILVKEEGRSYAEVAAALNISPKTVDAQLQKALHILRSALSDYQPQTPSAHHRHRSLLFLLTVV